MAKITGFITVGVPWQRSRTRGVVIAQIDSRDQPRYVPLPPAGPPYNVSAITSPVEQCIDLAWTNGTGQPATTEIWVSSDNVTFTLLDTVQLGTVTYRHNTGAFGVTRYYELRHTNAANESAFCAVVSAVSQVDYPDAPPTGCGIVISARPQGETQFTVNWTNGDVTAATEVWIRANAGAWSLYQTVAAGLATLLVTGRVANTPYDVEVRHTKSGVVSAYSNVASGRTLVDGPDAPPSALTATQGAGVSGQGIINLGWTNGDSSASTNIYVSTDNGASFSFLTVVGPGVATYAHNVGAFNVRRDYKVSHIKNAIEVGFSNVANANSGLDIPDAPPSALSLTVPSTRPAGETQLNASWTNGDASCQTVAQLTKVSDNSVVATNTVAAGLNSTSFTGLTPNTQYRLTIWHTKSGVNSATVQATQTTLVDGPDADPSNPAVVDNGGGNVTFSWTNGDVTASTEIWRDGALLTTVAPGVTSYATNTGGGVTSAWKARHTKNSVTSNFTAQVSITTGAAPAAPNFTSLASGTGQFTLNWTNGASLPIAVYESSDGVTFALKTTLAAGTTSYTPTGYGENAHRWFKLSHSQNGFESFSATRNAWTFDKPNGSPSAPNETNIKYYSATLNWTNGDATVQTEVWYRKQGAPSYTKLTTVAAGVATAALAGLLVGTTYEWFARHTITDNTGTTWTADSPVHSFSTVAAPVITSITGQNGAISVAWTSGRADVSVVAQARRTSDNSLISSAGPDVGTPNADVINGLQNDTQYSVTLVGTLGGETANSAASVVHTTAFPANPTGLNTTNITANSIQSNWTNPGSGYNGIRVRIYRASDNALIGDVSLAAGNTNKVWTGLATGTTYYWTVEAYFAGTYDTYYSTVQTSPNVTTLNPPAGPPTGCSVSDSSYCIDAGSADGIPEVIGWQVTATWTNGDAAASTEVWVDRTGGGFSLDSTAGPGSGIANIAMDGPGEGVSVKVRHLKNGLYSAFSNVATGSTTALDPCAGAH